MKLLAPALFLISALQATDALIMPLLLGVLRERTWPGEETTHLIVFYNAGAAIGPILATWLFPLASSRRLVLFALMIHGAANLLFATLPDFGIALALRSAAGAASGILSYAQLGAAAAAGSAAVSAMTAGSLFAMVVGSPVGSIAVDRFGAAPAFKALAAAAGATILLGGRALTRSTGATGAEPRGFLQLLRVPPLRKALAASMLIAAAISGPTTVLPAVLQSEEGAGLSLTQVGMLYLFAGAGPILALFLAPVTNRRSTQRRISIGGAALLTLVLLLIPFAARSAPLAGVLLVTALLIETLRRAALQHHVATLAPAADVARFLGLRGVFVQTALALGNATAAAVLATSGFLAVGVLAALAAFASALLVPHRIVQDPGK